MLPKKKPNFIHKIFSGVNIEELIRPNNKKNKAINKNSIFKSFPFNIGHKEKIKNTIKKTIPKLRLELFFNSSILLVYITLSFSSNASINSFHSLFERPDSSKEMLSPLIIF